MTLDTVAAEMRARFTPEQADQPVTRAFITAEEWNVLASAIYLRDVVQEAIASGRVPEDKARKAIERSKGAR